MLDYVKKIVKDDLKACKFQKVTPDLLKTYTERINALITEARKHGYPATLKSLRADGDHDIIMELSIVPVVGVFNITESDK